jgi:hypothetical protein
MIYVGIWIFALSCWVVGVILHAGYKWSKWLAFVPHIDRDGVVNAIGTVLLYVGELTAFIMFGVFAIAMTK